MYEKEAVNLLKDNNFTCVLYNENEVITKTQRGIKPLLEFLDSDKTFIHFSAVDKVVGKAAAFLYVLLGVKHLYAVIVSRPALDVLNRYGITTKYETLTEKIQNRTKTGFCPMETAVWDIDNPDDALKKLREKLAELTKTSAPD